MGSFDKVAIVGCNVAEPTCRTSIVVGFKYQGTKGGRAGLLLALLSDITDQFFRVFLIFAAV